MDLPFVEVYRVKDVQFRPRFHTTWKHSDQAYNEINYEINRAHSRLATINERSLDVVNDLSLHSDDDLDDDIKEVDDDYFDDGDDSDDTHRPKSGSEASKPNSESVSLAETNSNDPRVRSENILLIRLSMCCMLSFSNEKALFGPCDPIPYHLDCRYCTCIYILII